MNTLFPVVICHFLIFLTLNTAFANDRIYQGKSMPSSETIVYNIQRFKEHKEKNRIQILGMQNLSSMGAYKIYYCWQENCDDEMYLIRLSSERWIIRDNLVPNMLTGGSWRTVVEMVK